MKKILFGFGTVAAVVAPVVAVVACDDNDNTEVEAKFKESTVKNGAELKTYAAQFNYTLTDTIANSVFNSLGGSATQALKLTAYKHVTAAGKEKNIAIIVKGGAQATKTTGTRDGITFLDSKWEFKAEDLKTANFVVFLHTYSPAEKAADTTINKDHSISWVKIEKDGNDVVALDIPTDAANRF